MIAKTILGIFRGIILMTLNVFVIALFLPLALYLLFMDWLENKDESVDG